MLQPSAICYAGGKGRPIRPTKGVYLEMQHIDRVRVVRLKMRSALKKQIIGHLYPSSPA